MAMTLVAMAEAIVAMQVAMSLRLLAVEAEVGVVAASTLG